MKKIAFDIMGNDHGTQAAVKATCKFAFENPDIQITLVGDSALIDSKLIQKHSNIIVKHSPNTIAYNQNIREELSKPSSMIDAVNMAANNEVDAVLSSGDSGMYLAAATLLVRRFPGITRPAFMPIIPTVHVNKKFVMLDVGANVECKPEYLLEWAKIATIFSKYMFKIDNPTVGQINIGTEEYKGGELQKETHILLKDSEVNYVGYVEPRDLLEYSCDIAVVDGFSGNLVLKSLEGAILSFKKILKKAILKNIFRKIAVLGLKGAFKEVGEQLDYRNVGAAWVLGVNSMMIKSHGSSDPKAYYGALYQIKKGFDGDVFNKIKNEYK